MSNDISTRQNSFVPPPPSSPPPPPPHDSMDSWSGSIDGVSVTIVNHDAGKSDLEKMRAIIEGRAAQRDSLKESTAEGDVPPPPPSSGWSPGADKIDSLDSWDREDDESIPPPPPSDNNSFSSEAAFSGSQAVRFKKQSDPSPHLISHNWSSQSLTGESEKAVGLGGHDIKEVTIESVRADQEKALEALHITIQACADPKILPGVAEIRIHRAIANLKTANDQLDKMQGGNDSRLATESFIKEAELAVENKKASAQGVDRSFNKSAPDKRERERDVLIARVDQAVEELRQTIEASSKDNIPIPKATAKIERAIKNLQKVEENSRKQMSAFEDEADISELTEAVEQEIQLAKEAIATIIGNEENSMNYVFSVSKNLVEELAVAKNPEEKTAVNKRIVAEADQKFDDFASAHKLRETLAFVTSAAHAAEHGEGLIDDPDARKLIGLAARRADEANNAAEKMPDVALRNAKESFQAAMKARAIIDGKYQKIITADSRRNAV